MDNKKKFSLDTFVASAGFKAFRAACLAIVLGLVFGFVVMLVASPTSAPAGILTVITGGFRKLADVFYFSIPIMMCGLSVGFAFKMGLFNIGASGQYTMGMFFALLVSFYLPLPAALDSVRWVFAILAGAVGGFMWGFIPGIFKSLLNVNEVITSIMFNYIGMYLVDMCILGSSVMYEADKTRTRYIPETAKLPSLGIKNSNLNIAIFFAVAIAIILYIVLNKTTFGYELRATGFNKNAAQYAGMNSKRNIILTMSIAGALSGLGGAFAILAPSTIAGSSMTYEPISIIAANGFNGIAVALLGASSPIGIIFSAFFISHIQRGGTLLAGLYGYKPEIIDMVIAIIIYFSAFSMMMSTYASKLFAKMKEKKAEKKSALALTKAEKNTEGGE